MGVLEGLGVIFHQWNLSAVVCWIAAVGGLNADETRSLEIQSSLEKAGDNRLQIASALEKTPKEQHRAMQFLIANMPPRDLKSLSADFLLNNVADAFRAWQESSWHARVPEDIFLNGVLPYASINEQRDAWRKEFRTKFAPLIAGVDSPGKAAAILNQKIFDMVQVKYSTGRPKADQSPFESIKAGKASCTGLAIILIDACRSVGIPARFVGTPRWSDQSGNHSWVEVWDDGWHFTGAAEPAGDRLDDAWFIGRASTAQREHPLHAIFAVSFKKTPILFPLVWDRNIDYVHAVNVTDRYANRVAPPPAGYGQVMFRVVDKQTGQRVAAKIVVRDAAGKIVFDGQSKDERFDANDHLTIQLPLKQPFKATADFQKFSRSQKFEVNANGTGNPITIELSPASRDAPAERSKQPRRTG